MLPKSLEYVSCLLHLAVFGIFGAITRYLLQKLFGPTGARVTSDGSILYLDLPSNMVGSFLMGWFGVILKADIARVSEFLAIGLSTGYLRSLTTFSGWNQKMLDLSANGRWVYAVLGFLLGLFSHHTPSFLGLKQPNVCILVVFSGAAFLDFQHFFLQAFVSSFRKLMGRSLRLRTKEIYQEQKAL